MKEENGRNIALKAYEDQRVADPGKEGFPDRALSIPELVVFVGEGSSGLLEGIRQVLEDLGLEEERRGFLKWISYASQDVFNLFQGAREYRVAVTASGEAELKKKLARIEAMIRERPEEGFSYPTAGMFYGKGEPVGKLAFLFPGQGSQYVGMGRELAAIYPTAREVWDRLGEMSFAGKTIKEVVFPPEPQNEEEAMGQRLRLAEADWTNPCISVAGEAIFQLLEAMGVHPDAVAAHSWGDVSSYRSAGILSDVDMIEATRYRGETVVKCPTATRGCVLVVHETATRIQAFLSEHHIKEAWIANYNAPSQIVLAGVKEDIFRAKEVFDDKGIDARLIPISAAPHCPLMVPMARDFGRYLETIDFKHASCDVYSYLFGRKVENEPERLRHTLWCQSEKPVRFTRQIQRMYEDGVRTFVEVGPAEVLTKCVALILGDKPHKAVNMDKKKEDSNLFFLLGIAQLLSEGRVHDLGVLWQGYRTPRYPLPVSSQGKNEGEEKTLRKLDLEFAKIDSLRSQNRR